MDASVIIAMQNGHPTASVDAPVDFASAKRVWLDSRCAAFLLLPHFVPARAATKRSAELRGISIVNAPQTSRSRGASKILLCLPK
ncbi:MAG: hypothetical protein U0X92_17075 [Anaerolineales bacterium]